MPASKTAAQILRELRQAHGGSLRATARHLQVAPSYLSRLESGERQVPETLEMKLANFYGTSPDVISVAQGRVPQDVVTILLNHPEELAALRLKYASEPEADAP